MPARDGPRPGCRACAEAPPRSGRRGARCSRRSRRADAVPRQPRRLTFCRRRTAPTRAPPPRRVPKAHWHGRSRACGRSRRHPCRVDRPPNRRAARSPATAEPWQRAPRRPLPRDRRRAIGLAFERDRLPRRRVSLSTPPRSPRSLRPEAGFWPPGRVFGQPTRTSRPRHRQQAGGGSLARSHADTDHPRGCRSRANRLWRARHTPPGRRRRKPPAGRGWPRRQRSLA